MTEKRKEYMAKYYQRNKERIKAQATKWTKDNKDRINLRARIKNAKTDDLYKVIELLIEELQDVGYFKNMALHEIYEYLFKAVNPLKYTINKEEVMK